MESEINALMKQLTKKIKSNLTHKKYIAMKELTKRKDLIISNVKNSGTESLWIQTTTSKNPISNYLRNQVISTQQVNQLKTQH